MSTELLDVWDVVGGLAKKIYNITFINESGENVYVSNAERTAEDQLAVETTDGFKFILTCEESARTQKGGA